MDIEQTRTLLMFVKILNTSGEIIHFFQKFETGVPKF